MDGETFDTLKRPHLQVIGDMLRMPHALHDAAKARSHALSGARWVERMGVTATRTCEFIRVAAASAVLAVGLMLASAPQAWAARNCEVKFVSLEAAVEQGIGAYKSGFYSIALPALTCASQGGSFLGQYHLARLFADSASTYTDHRQAYELYRGIVEEHAATIDVDDDGRAPYVGQALTAYAGYWLHGLPEIGLRANPAQAAFFLQQAATFFRNHDAQFELAKLYLKGDGVREDHKRALNWLSVLTQEGHASAQAFLADLLWRGKIVPKDEQRALALITVAVENSPPHERIWIETIYQSIFCGTTVDLRRQTGPLVDSFREQYASRREQAPSDEHGSLGVPSRTCVGGEPVKIPQRDSRMAPGSNAPNASLTPSGMMGVRGQPRSK